MNLSLFKKVQILLSLLLLFGVSTEYIKTMSIASDLITTALDIDNLNVELQNQVKQSSILKHQSPDDICLEEFNLYYALELKFKVADIITARIGFSVINSSTAGLMHWITAILISAENSTIAIAKWKNLAHKKSLHTLWPTLQQIIELPDEVIRDLYSHAQRYAHSAQPTIIAEILVRLHKPYGHAWNDDYEIKQTRHSIRSLYALQQHGLQIKCSESHRNRLKKIIQNTPSCPIIEILKNEKILTINGFSNSKVSLMIHDSFDHFWIYTFLERQMILEKYKNFLQKVGNPHSTDIFCREGELIASIAYEFRYSYLSHSFDSLLDFNQIADLFQEPTLSENQRDALNTLINNNDLDEFIRYLPRVISGIMIELMDQRRKYGFIRSLDRNFQQGGRLPTLDLEYVALIIEIFNLLYQHKEEAFKKLLNITLILENYLFEFIHNNRSSLLSVTLNDIENFDATGMNLPPERIQWFRDNLGAISSKNVTC